MDEKKFKRGDWVRLGHPRYGYYDGEVGRVSGVSQQGSRVIYSVDMGDGTVLSAEGGDMVPVEARRRPGKGAGGREVIP